MTCDKPYNVKVTEGNAFTLLLLLYTRQFVDDEAVDTAIDCTELSDIVVKVNDTEWDDVQATSDGVEVYIPDTQARGTYNVTLTATYNGQTIREAWFECFTIVAWSYQSNAQNFIPASPVESESHFVIAGVFSDDELDELKTEYQEKIAAAEQAEADADEAKEEWEEKAAALDDVATETNATANKEEIIAAIPTDYAKEETLTDTQATALAVLNAIATNMYKGVPIVSQTTDATIAPNVWNVWGEVDSLTITKGTDLDDVVNEYMIRFTATDSTAITFSGFTLVWYGGSEPTWTEGATYEISIIDNLALWAEFTEE